VKKSIEFVANTTIAAAILIAAPLAVAQAEGASNGTGQSGQSIGIGIGLPSSAGRFSGLIGIGLGVAPDYEGSDRYGLTALPLADIRYPGFLFIKGASVNPNDGLVSAGWNLLNVTYASGSGPRVRLSLGPFVRYRSGRDQDDNDALKGLGDIDGSVSLGGFAELTAGPWSMEVNAAPEVTGGSDGVLVAFGARYTTKLSKDFDVSLGVSASWANKDYMQGTFGVSATQAARSGLARFNASAGFKDVGADIRTSYALSESFSLVGQVGYRRLLGSADDSPIVNGTGSPHQFRAIVGIAVRF